MSLESLATWLGGRGASVPGCPSDCHPQPHADLGGDAVGLSGARNLQPDPGSCCAACKSHAAKAAVAGGRPCNVWVHCGDAERCGTNHRHCWLKRQRDPLHAPAVGGLGWSWNRLVPWTSGVLSDGGADGANLSGRRHAVDAAPSVAFAVPGLGRVRVRLARAASPNATRWLTTRAAAAAGSSSSSCAGCRFYRAEPVPPGWGRRWFFGPPYALLQGSFGGRASEPFPLLPGPAEGGLVLDRGSLIMIDKGPDFLIGLARHPEWATSYTHLGDVVAEDMAAVVDAIMRTPLVVQNWGAINATVLKEPLGFRLEPAAS